MKIGRAGTILRDLLKSRHSGGNSSPVTVTAAEITICKTGTFAVDNGDFLWIGYSWSILKGGTLGNIQVRLNQTAGTGLMSWLWLTFALARFLYPSVPAAGTIRDAGSLFAIVTQAGTIEISMLGTSAGSDSTLAVNDAWINVLVF